MNTCAAVQLHRVVLVSLPARLTDAVVNGDVDGGVELQRENVGGRKWVALPQRLLHTPQPWTGHCKFGVGMLSTLVNKRRSQQKYRRSRRAAGCEFGRGV